MKILHLSASDLRGGAALAAYRLHKGLQRAGQDSAMLVESKLSGDPSVLRVPTPQSAGARLGRRLRGLQLRLDFRGYRRTRPEGYEAFSDDRTRIAGQILAEIPPGDIINLHWIAGFVDYRVLFKRMGGRRPFVWRLADMSALTGGCHYDDHCGGFARECGRCPQLGSTRSNDLSHQIWERKREALNALDDADLHIVSLCRWMSDMVAASPLLRRFPRTEIPNGVDLDAFAPRDREFARSVLGIPREARVVMFVSDQLSNRRKGFALLLDALSGMRSHPGLFLVSVGSGWAPRTDGIPCLHVGHASNERLLSLIYSAADLFVIPSLQDNLPNTVLEAMACGTPVVGFGVGGILDMVREGETGLLVEAGDLPALRGALGAILGDPRLRAEMGGAARRVAETEYARELQVQRYINLYEAMLSRVSEGATRTDGVKRVKVDSEGGAVARQQTAKGTRSKRVLGTAGNRTREPLEAVNPGAGV